MQERPPKVVEGPFEDIAILAGTNGALLQLSMNGQFVTTVSGPYGQVWDAATGTQVGSISQLQPTSVSMVGTAIAVVGSEDGLVAVWAIQYPPGDYPEEGALPDPFDWSMAGASLITAFNLEQPIVQVLSDPLSEKTFVLTTRGELYIYTPGSDGFYGRVDSALQTLQTQGGERDIGYGVLAALEPGAAHIAYASERNLLTVVALQHGEPRPATEYTLEQNIGCVAYSPDGNLLLIGENNDLGTLHILETGRYARIAQVSAGSPIRSCTFSADGTWIATGHDDGSIIVWGAK